MTLLELLVSTIILVAISLVSVREVSMRIALNEHSRAVSWAMADADRVMEHLRGQNIGCVTPSAAPPPNPPGPDFASWDAWLADTSANGGGGKNLQALGGLNEVVQVLPAGGPDPVGVTVAVCWTHRNRAIGDCDATDGAISSPVMLSTTLTCR